jgi:hypothetical protein
MAEGSAVYADSDSVWGEIVLGDAGAVGSPPPGDPPSIDPLERRLYRNPAVTAQVTLSAQGFSATIPAGGGNLDVTAHQAEFYRLFVHNGQRVFKYEPWS